mgnify:FL=1
MDLIHGDCLEVMKTLDSNSIDLLFCDLPYGCMKNACVWDEELDLGLFWEQVNRICRDTTPMFFCCNTKFGNTLINSNEKNFKFDVVFLKSKSTSFLLAKKQPMRKHELIYAFYRKQPAIYGENITKLHTRKLLKEYKNNRNESTSPLPLTVLKEGESNIYGTNYTAKKLYVKQENNSSLYDPPLPTSVLEIKKEGRLHPTQKPVELMEWFIKYYTKEGDVVLDPTAGSGSTGEACRNLNRKFIGIEKNEEFFDIMFNRLID